MLIRLTLRNFLSFNEDTEFNLLPNKSQRLPHHKINRNGIDFLKMSAIYGANGSGKSNMIKAVANLERFVLEGKIPRNADRFKFKLSKANSALPSSVGVEFYSNQKIFYYALTFDAGTVVHEVLMESNKDEDILIFERENIEGKQKIQFFSGYIEDPKNALFTQVLSEKLLQKEELLLSFLNSKYKEEFLDVSTAFEWFEKTLVVIHADAVVEAIPHVLDKYSELMQFSNKLLPTFNTGIDNLWIKKEKLEDVVGTKAFKGLSEIVDRLKKEPESVSTLGNRTTGEEFALSLEDDQITVKALVANHLDENGNPVEFSMSLESDGTRRLIDYMPAIFHIIEKESVYLIDEIERSIHPKTIKELITKISLDENVKGQLIFTTHESCLLDQEILRPDEIWFAQKSIDGSSKLYPLSDFNIHHTANIENGYLNGRFGGIPFLSNLMDLNWHKYDVSE